MIVLFNPTNEILVGWHIGIEYKIQPGDKLKVQDPTANHLLNHLGTRGLISLEFGDEGDTFKAKAEAAVKRNHDFKAKQVRDHNYRNEQRKAQGLVYLPPTPLVKQYATELGMVLVEPYAAKVEEAAGVKELKELVNGQQKQIKDILDTMTQLMAALVQNQQQQNSKPDGDEKGKKK